MAEQYVDTPLVLLSLHKFVKLTEVNPDFAELPKVDNSDDPFNYMLEVYMDNYILLSIARNWAQLRHVANAVMTEIHDVFLPDKDDEDDVISLRNIYIYKEVVWAVLKTVLVFDSDGNPGEHSIWLTGDHFTNILAILKKWIREGEHRKKGITFEEFWTYLEK